MATAWHRSIAPWQWGLLALATVFLCTRGLDGGDLEIFLEASRRMLTGRSVYGEWVPRHDGEAMKFYYGPLFALLIGPLTHVPLAVAVVLWQMVRTVALFRTWHLLQVHFGMRLSGTNGTLAAIVGCLLLSGRALLLDFDLGQMTVIITWACLESMAGFRIGRALGASVVLALAIMIKVLPLVLLPYLFFRGRWRDLLFTIGAMALLFALPALWYGWSQSIALHRAWWSSLDPFGGGHALETSLGIHGLPAMVPAYLMETESEVHLRRHLFQLQPFTVEVVLNVVRVLLVLSVLLFMRPGFFRGWRGAVRDLGDLAYILLLVPLLFPHQQKYAFALLMPAGCWLMHRWWRERSNVLLLLLLIAAVLLTLTSDLFIGMEGSRIAQHYKTMTWGALVLGAAMWWARGRSPESEGIIAPPS